MVLLGAGIGPPPPSSGKTDAWILSRLLIFIMPLWRHSYEVGIEAPGLHIGTFFVELTRHT